MERIYLHKQDLKGLIKQGSINNGTIYCKNGKKIKLDRDFINDITRKHVMARGKYSVDFDQIAWLSSKQRDVQKSTLPSGLITYQGVDVGIIYPRFFEGYYDFKNISREDTIRILKNIRTAIMNNEELIDKGILNQGLICKNIIYKDDDVQLINLDGKYIKKEGMASYSSIYEYFLDDLYNVLEATLKVKCRGHASEYSKGVLALREILKYRADLNKRDCPIRAIDEIERARILK